MKTVQLHNFGRSQVVQLPEDCRFEGTEVYIKQQGGMVILFPKDQPLSLLFSSSDKFSDDYMSCREQPSEQERKF